MLLVSTPADIKYRNMKSNRIIIYFSVEKIKRGQIQLS